MAEEEQRKAETKQMFEWAEAVEEDKKSRPLQDWGSPSLL